MLVKIFTIQFDPVLQEFDANPLYEFIRDKEILSVKDHFFVKNETPYLALVVQYMPVQDENRQIRPSDRKSKKTDESWRELISENELPLFNTLRDWRNEKSKKEGIPPFIICTNLQLAHIIKNRPCSLNGLLQINGLGKAKVEKYGGDILGIIGNQCQKPEESQKETAKIEEQIKPKENATNEQQKSKDSP